MYDVIAGPLTCGITAVCMMIGFLVFLVLVPVRHDYLSTACYHAHHERCRRKCKFCAAKCRCACHKK